MPKICLFFSKECCLFCFYFYFYFYFYFVFLSFFLATITRSLRNNNEIKSVLTKVGPGHLRSWRNLAFSHYRNHSRRQTIQRAAKAGPLEKEKEFFHDERKPEKGKKDSQTFRRDLDRKLKTLLDGC